MRDEAEDLELEHLRAIVVSLRRPESAVPAQGRNHPGPIPGPSPIPGVPRRSLEMLHDLLGTNGCGPRAAARPPSSPPAGTPNGSETGGEPAGDGFERLWELYWLAFGLDHGPSAGASGAPADAGASYLELLKPHFAEAWRRAQDACGALTPGQHRVLELVRDGHTNRQVARELEISEATVRTHLQNAYIALGVNNRVAAVGAAFGAGDADV